MDADMKLNEKIRARRKEKKLSMAQLANAVGVSSSTICKIESGEIKTFKNNVASKLSLFLNIPLYEFFGQQDKGDEGEQVNWDKAIPIYERIGCGMPAYGSDDITGYLPMSDDTNTDGLIAIRTRGDSMEPYIYDGDIAVIRVQPAVDNGQIAAVRIGADELVLKIFNLYKGGVMLQSYNKEKYPPMIYSWEDAATLPVTVIGRLKQIVRRY